MLTPILFNTDMVRAILDGRKSIARRIVKQLRGVELPPDTQLYISPHSGLIYWKGIDRQLTVDGNSVMEPYHPGDILYVRETWADTGGGHILYRADATKRGSAAFYLDGRAGSIYNGGVRWRPSIHMPKEAARIFLRATDVRVERLQDIHAYEMEKEGLNVSWGEGIMGAWKSLWDSTIKPADRGTCGWEANPWVWVINFERIERTKLFLPVSECHRL